MELISAIFILIINFIVINQKKKAINFLSVFSLFWLLMIAFSKMRLFNLNETSSKAYFIVDLGGVCFALSYLIFSNVRIGKTVRMNLRQNTVERIKNTEEINFGLYIFLFIIVSIFQTIFLIRALTILFNGGNLQLIHRAIRETDGSGVIRYHFESLFNYLLVQPFIFSSIVISLVSLFKRIKHYKSIFLMSLFLSLSYFITHAGRIIIIDYIVYIVLLMQISSIKISKRKKRIVCFALVLGIVSIVFITASRRGDVVSSEYIKNSFLKEIYDYFAIPLPQLSYWIDQSDNNDFYSYGLGAFNGLIQLPLQLLSKFGLDTSGYVTAIGEINKTELVYTRAAYSDTTYNAFVTAFYFFYADFRYVGVIIGSSIYGMMSGIIDNKFQNKSLMSLAFYLLFSQSLARVFARWQFYRTNYILSFALVFILFHRFGLFKRKNII